MVESLTTKRRLLCGVVAPLGFLLIGLVVVSLSETGAGAAEFAALGIMLGSMIAMPFVLIFNLVIAFLVSTTPKNCFARGLLFPSTVLIGAIVYQTGLWDSLA